MVGLQEDNKIEIDIKLRLTKTQLNIVKKFVGLDSSVSNETSLKALVMAVARQSIRKPSY